jgi:hypothetical protein
LVVESALELSQSGEKGEFVAGEIVYLYFQLMDLALKEGDFDI